MAEREKKICGGGKRYCICCSNFAGKVIDGRIVKLHSIPADKRRKRAWEQRLRLIRKDYNKVKYPCVCSEHFVQRRGPRPGDDVPSVFPTRTFKISTVSTAEEIQDATKYFEGTDEEPAAQDPALETSPAMDTDQTSAAQNDLAPPAFSVILHDYAGPVDIESIFKPTLCTAACQTEKRLYADVALQIGSFVVTGMPMSVTGKPKATQTSDKDHVQFTPLRYEHICNNDEMVRLYTGIRDAATLQEMFDELPSIDDSTTTNGNIGRKCLLQPIDQFLMTLMRLKLGLMLEDLCFRFSVSKATCSRIVNKWIDHLYIHFSKTSDLQVSQEASVV